MLTGITGSAAYLVDGIVHDIRPGTVVWALAGQQHFLLSESSEFDMWVALVSSRILAHAPDMPRPLPVLLLPSLRPPPHARPGLFLAARLLFPPRHGPAAAAAAPYPLHARASPPSEPV